MGEHHPPYSSVFASNSSLAQYRDQQPTLCWLTSDKKPGVPVDLSFPYLGPGVFNRSRLDCLDWSQKSMVEAVRLKNLDGSADQVASKTIFVSPQDGERVKRELRILSTVDHKHVVAVIGSFVVAVQNQNPRFGILMYPLAPLNLEKLVDDVSKYNATQVESTWSPHPHMPHLLSYCACLCNTLLHLHRRANPIKHRDIKPSNILIDKDDNVMLADFDISKEYDSVKRAITIGLTECTVRYAPGYLLNRQVQEAIERGLEWDTISMGFVLLEMANVVFGRSTEEMISHLLVGNARDVVYSQALSEGKIETWLLVLKNTARNTPWTVPQQLRSRAGSFLNAIYDLMKCPINDDGPLAKHYRLSGDSAKNVTTAIIDMFTSIAQDILCRLVVVI